MFTVRLPEEETFETKVAYHRLKLFIKEDLSKKLAMNIEKTP